jgi:hypothetical protein
VGSCRIASLRTETDLSDSGSQLTLGNLRLYWDILRLRRGAEDLPVSLVLLAMTVAARVACGVLIAETSPQPETHASALVLIDSAVTLFWGWALLRVAGRPERFAQMMCAVFGVELVLQPLLAPAAWFYAVYAKDPTTGPLAMLALSALGIWALVAVVRVVRGATGWPAFACVALAIGQELITMLLAVMVFPDLLPRQGLT